MTESQNHKGGNQTGGATVSWGSLHVEALARFRAAQVEEAEVSARRIIEECSGNEGPDFAVGLNQPATQRGVAAFDKKVARRLDGEPLQYVIGRWGFRTLDLFIDQRVLIPRPETEVVAGLAIAELERLVASDDSNPKAADLGTGSGAIGLSIAAEVANVEVWLTDVSEDALAVATANLAGLGRGGTGVRIATAGSWFAPMPSSLRGKLDVVVCNPPYVSSEDTLEPSVRDWEPHQALIAGSNGMEGLKLLVAEAPEWISARGALVLEMAPWQTTEIAELASGRFKEVAIETDMAGLNRCVVARFPKRP